MPFDPVRIPHIMMNDIIKLDKITKAYNIYNHPLDRVKEAFHPFRKKYYNRFYALRDVTFTIARGESIGVIGQNGSGKTTLLKLISGIFPPTEGRLEVDGKIAALLELGTGFNPEFTGRENIYLNGTLLGLTIDEINEYYDEIVAFSGIGDFIGQPVKQYSSGMVVRLAFSIATHVWADILIIDEALAVGDEAFQRKCFALLQEFKKKGNTLIFVSHSPNAVVELCDRALLLENGKLLLDDKPGITVREYHKRLFSPTGECTHTHLTSIEPNEPGVSSNITRVQHCYWEPSLISQSTVSYTPQGARIRNASIRNHNEQKVNTLYPGEVCFFTYETEFTEDSFQIVFGSMIKTISGLGLGGMISHPLTSPLSHVSKGAIADVRFKFVCNLAPGVYFFNAGVTGYKDGTQTYLHRVVDAVMFRVQSKECLLTTGTVDFSDKQKPVVTLRTSDDVLAGATG